MNVYETILPIKIFDEDITIDNLIEFVSTDDYCKDIIKNGQMWLTINHSKDYFFVQDMSAVGGIFKEFIEQDKQIKAKVLLFDNMWGNDMKDLITYGNGIDLYITPHGMKEDGKIKLCTKDGLRKHVFDTKKMLLRGVHNFENAACAIIATKDLVTPKAVEEVLTTFKGVEHRLELVKETENRVKWYNDSVSSSPTRTIAGLNAFTFKNIILIAGGYDKNLDYDVIGKPIVDNCKAVVLLGQTADKIDQAIRKESDDFPVYKTKSLEEAIKVSESLTVKGDIVLFSPASASFDMFKNFAERGEIFKRLVGELIK